MHAFRRKGYFGVSIPELETATGLSAGSIYNSFKDKRGIFLAAFEQYLLTVLKRRIAEFASPERQLSGLRQLFLSLLREPDGGNVRMPHHKFGDRVRRPRSRHRRAYLSQGFCNSGAPLSRTPDGREIVRRAAGRSAPQGGGREAARALSGHARSHSRRL